TPARGVFDLLPARDARRDHNGVRVVFHGRKETAAAYGNRNVVMFLFVAERAGHAAAAGIDFFDWISKRNGFLQITRADKRLLVTMSVDKSFRLLPLEFKLPSSRLFLFYDEFFE